MLRKRSMGSRACNISASARLSVGKNNRTSPPLISQRDACPDQFAQKFFLREDRGLDGIDLSFQRARRRRTARPRDRAAASRQAAARCVHSLRNRVRFFAHGSRSRRFSVARRGRGLHSRGRRGSCRRPCDDAGGKRGAGAAAARRDMARGLRPMRLRTAPALAVARSSAFQIGENFFERRQARGVHHAQQAHLQMQARIRLAAQIVVGMQQNLEKAREVFLAEKFRGLLQALAARRRARQSVRNPLRKRARRADCENGRWPRGRNAAGFALRRAGDARARARARPIALRSRRSARPEFRRGRRRAVRAPARP